MGEQAPGMADLNGEERRNPPGRPVGDSEGAGLAEYPLSASQQGIWFFYCAAPDNPAYNTGVALRVSPRLDLAAFDLAVQTLVQAHDGLRTVFRAGDEYPVQLVLSHVRLPIETIQAGGWSGEQLEQHLRAARQQPFDLEAGPLIRVQVFERGDEQVVLISVHHIVFDGWSSGILLDQLRGYYEQALHTGRAEPLRPQSSYREHVAAEAKYLASARAERSLSFWARYLDPLPPTLALPYDYERPAVHRFRSAVVPMDLDAELSAGLRGLAAGESATLYPVLLSAYGLLLRSITGESEFTVGMPVAGRNETGFRNVIGCFINLAPVRLTVNPDSNCRELIHAVRARLLAAMRHSRCPFSRIVERTHQRGDPARHPICQTALNMFHPHAEMSQDDLNTLTAGGAMRIGDSRMSVVSIGQQEGLFDLAIDLADSGSGVVGQLSYNTDLFRKETACALRDRYLGLLARLVQFPDHLVAEDLPVAEADREELEL